MFEKMKMTMTMTMTMTIMRLTMMASRTPRVLQAIQCRLHSTKLTTVTARSLASQWCS